ncbi:MAG: hypothetical protein AB1714_01150 [Acidobacteriota bacterium]
MCFRILATTSDCIRALPEVTSENVGRISDGEMARINIEASAALAEWIELYGADGGGRIYTRLLDRATSYLPVPTKVAKLKSDRFAALADPARHILEVVGHGDDPAWGRSHRSQTESVAVPNGDRRMGS